MARSRSPRLEKIPDDRPPPAETYIRAKHRRSAHPRVVERTVPAPLVTASCHCVRAQSLARFVSIRNAIGSRRGATYEPNSRREQDGGCVDGRDVIQFDAWTVIASTAKMRLARRYSWVSHDDEQHLEVGHGKQEAAFAAMRLRVSVKYLNRSTRRPSGEGAGVVAQHDLLRDELTQR